jgi:hypothetical protein
MKSHLFALLVLCTQPLSGRPREDLDLAIREFPDPIVNVYRPDTAAKSANVLLSATKEATYEALGAAIGTGNDSDDDRRLCLLLRLLFRSTNAGTPLRPPRLGSLSKIPENSMSEKEWPDLPFVISSGVPISMCTGYNLSGSAESAKSYLTYCRANGKLREVAFVVPDRKRATNALNGVFSSPAWTSLKWEDSGPGWRFQHDEKRVKQLLWKQVLNIDR